MMSTTEEKTPQRIPVSKDRLKLTGDGTEGVLLGTKCKSCGTHFLGARRFCANCTSDEVEAVELSKKGTLSSYTVVWAPPQGWKGDVPYILGQVRFPEGVSVLSEVVDLPREEIKIGMPMELTLRVGDVDPDGNEVVVYKWRPTSR